MKYELVNESKLMKNNLRRLECVPEEIMEF